MRASASGTIKSVEAAIEADSGTIHMSTKIAIIVQSGFLQDPDEWKESDEDVGGLWRLYQDLCEQYKSDYEVLIEPWDADPVEIAQSIAKADADVVVSVHYSYGAGWGLQRMEKPFQDRGLRIDSCFIIDGVPRWRFILLRWLSLTRWFRLRVPAVVDTVMSWRQVNYPPYGRKLKCANKKTRVIKSVAIGSPDNLRDYAGSGEVQVTNSEASHLNVDGMDMIHREVKKRIKKLRRSATASTKR